MGRRCIRSAALGLVLPLLALTAGCLELDVRVKIIEDGTFTVTEKVRFSEGLLDLARTRADKDLASLLTKAAILDRLKHMGKDVSLMSHELNDLPGGDKQSIAVYKIEDLNEFMYVSPFLGYTDYPQNHVVKGFCQPLMKSRNYGGAAGQMAVAFRPTSPPGRTPRAERGRQIGAALTPAELQEFREVRPIFRDMLKGFKLRFTFESYAPIAHTGFGFRGYKEHVNFVDLINFTDEDLDRYGQVFCENEEIMLDLVRWRPGSLNIVETVTQAAVNNSVPVFLTWGSPYSPWIQSDEIYFAPSRQLFDKHFAGKTLDQGRWGPGPMVPAKFEEIGHKPDRPPATTTRP